MIRVFLASVLISTAISTQAQSSGLPQAAADNAKKYLHVREKTNHNDAPEIDRWLAYLGLPKGLSYCAAFSIYNFKEAADVLNVKQPWPRYGRVSMLKEVCQRNPLKYRWIAADEVRFGTVQLHPGDLPMWAAGAIRGGDFNGHTGLVQSQLSNLKFRTIEGNTMPGNTGNQREGGGVYQRTRTITLGNFRLLGFCRIR